MIISHQHKYIFFAIPKTGTHSVRQALRQSMGENDIEQVGLFVKKKFPFPELADIPHGHITAQQIRPIVGEEIFTTYKKFAFVRNPFDRFVSYCAFMSRKNNRFSSDPIGFMKYIIRDLQPVNQLLFLPQYKFVTDKTDQLQLNLIGRNETMQTSFNNICDSLGIERIELGHVNSSIHRPYQEYYDKELIEWVSTLYEKDLELFNYQFD